MPTPKGTGAPLQPISMVGPGRYGLNKQTSSSVLGPEWATEALNCVFDESGRLASRKGVESLTATPVSGLPALKVIHEYLRENGSSVILSTGGSKIYSGTSAPTDITGTATITVGDNWQFLNFNDVVIGVQQGEKPIRYTGSGSFADITESAGTCPTGNCGVAAFGRLWIADSDKQTIKYTTLLSYTDWGSTGSGSIDMSSVWPGGMDEVTAIAAYNGQLVVFGKRHIIFWTDGSGSSIGITASSIYVADTIFGVGCIARDTVKQTDNGDMLFLSDSGVQSIQRVIQERSNPFNNVSSNVRDYLLSYLSLDDATSIKSVYNPREGFYLLIMPNSGRAFCFDTRFRLPDGTYRVTEWTTNMKAAAYLRSRSMYTVTGVGGYIFEYKGYNDVTSREEGTGLGIIWASGVWNEAIWNRAIWEQTGDPGIEATSYTYKYMSGWLDLGEQAAEYIKQLKSVTGVVYVATLGTGLTVFWDFDFENNPNYAFLTFVGDTTSEWGVGEWGEMEWSGGQALRKWSVPANGGGQYIQVGVTGDVDSSLLALQQINLYAKIGRLAN